MVEETFVAPTPKEAFELAKAKYGTFSHLKLLRARHIQNGSGELVSEITIAIDSKDYLNSIGKSIVNDVISRFEKLGLKREWLLDRCKDYETKDKETLVSLLLEQIDKELTVSTDETNSSKVMIMVGPTGVGKTTTIAKMAAMYLYTMQNSKSVAFVNLDTFRAGAYEQLENFANILQIEHHYVEHSQNFLSTLQKLQNYDRVLVDTAGISPYDTNRLIKTIEYLKEIEELSVEIVLVISATAKYSDMLDIYEQFSFIEPQKCIVTKLDETKNIGELIAFLLHTKLPVGYLATGQEVPDDLEIATKERLLGYFVGERYV